MIKLTPELYCLSSFSAAAAGIETRELNFNLARRSGIIINSIYGVIEIWTDNAVANQYIAQELDLDPDNVDVWEASANPDAFVYDSSRLFRQVALAATMEATLIGVYHTDSQLVRDWTHLPLEQRPISITSVRHHLRCIGDVQGYHGLLHIAYHIIELSLTELGIINASRR